MHQVHHGSPIDSASRQSSSPWRKGCLLGLILLPVALWLLAPGNEACALDSLGPFNYLSLNVGGFSLFVSWKSFGCR